MAKARSPADKMLAAACKAGDLPAARDALDAGARADELLEGNLRANMLGLAIESGSPPLVQELVRRGARPWDMAWSWRAAFGCCCAAEESIRRDKPELLAALDAGGCLLAPEKHGRLLALASMRRAKACLDWLLPRVDIEARDGWHLSGLGHACRSGWPAGVRALLDAGADPGRSDGRLNHVTPLMLATKQRGDKDIPSGAPCVSLMLAAGADPLAVDSAGATALHWAVKNKNLAAILLLVDSPAREMRDNEGVTASARAQAWIKDEAILLAFAAASPEAPPRRLRI